MIKEDYVSFEVANLLKEKGFDEPCFRYAESKEIYESGDWMVANVTGGAVGVPTLQMAMKWLREVHKVEVRVFYDIDKTTWWGGCNPMYEENEENSNMFQSLLGFDYQGKTYEKACEAAIKYCLENLI